MLIDIRTVEAKMTNPQHHRSIILTETSPQRVYVNEQQEKTENVHTSHITSQVKEKCIFLQAHFKELHNDLPYGL